MKQMDLPLLMPGEAEVRVAQALMAFLLRLRARGISDLSVLRALEVVPRDVFVPHRYRDLALRDIALPIACGQTMPEAWLVARMMEALDLSQGHRVLEVGSGSGYATAILARLAGEVVSCEIFEPLAVECAARLSRLGLAHVKVLHGDVLDLLPDLGLFDRILVHGVIEATPPVLMESLAEGGVILLGRKGPRGMAQLTRIAHQKSGDFTETPMGPCRLGALIGPIAALI
jgi:protein-L-isoaspartate(D-aspartate) O-methyltransferase